MRGRQSEDSPVLLDRFLNDAIGPTSTARPTERGVGGVMEHIGRPGVPRATRRALPPHSLSPAVVAEMKRQTALMARAEGLD